MTKENLTPLKINKQLAKAVGLKESLFILRIVELSKFNNKNVKIYDELTWIRRSLKEWHNDFDFLSIDTIRRNLGKLKDNHIIYSENLNDDKRDNTLWYSINILEIDFLLTGDTGSAELNEQLKQEKQQKNNS